MLGKDGCMRDDRGSKHGSEDQEDPQAPLTVVASTRLFSDIRAILELLKGDGPPVVQIRSSNMVSVVFGFGDASGTGLGATFTCGKGFTFRIEVLFTNVVESLKEEAESGRFGHSEVFMFTDNATVESCSHKGSSSSPKLLMLIIRLKAMATRRSIRFHIFHVAGTRIIVQGTDGVSRGNLAQGIMSGETMTAFIPIYLSATQRSNEVVNWVRTWAGKNIMLLTEEGWFQDGHDISGWSREAVVG